MLSRSLLASTPLLVLVDNFEDNLVSAESGFELKDRSLAALLARWARNPGASRLLVTCRYPFPLPKDAQRRLATFHLGPLSFAETRKLLWRLPALGALEPEEKLRAYSDVGGHPRALEYLDALLRGGEARFPDVAENLKRALRAREGIEHPAEWLAGVAGDLDRALAETVTLAVDDVLLGELLDRLEGRPLARELLLGASVYRLPVDDVGLVWQVGEAQETDPDLRKRVGDYFGRRREARRAKKEPSPEALGYDEAGWRQVQADLEAWQRPPVEAPAGLAEAVGALLDLGLLSTLAEGGEARLWAVHRWTARALAALADPEAVRETHRRAAGYWRFRVERVPQSPEADLAQLYEARFHHHEGGELDRALSLTRLIGERLELQGAYRRAEQLYVETLSWVPTGSRDEAVYSHQLGIVAQKRGSYEEALEWYRKSLAIEKDLGNRAGMASTLSQLGILAMERGDPVGGVPLNLRSLAIRLAIGVPEVCIDLFWLGRQREVLGEEQFGEILDEHLDEASRKQVLELMESSGD